MVVSGEQSKVIPDKVGLSVSTVHNHRANIMKKLRTKTSADLTRVAEEMGSRLLTSESLAE